MIVNAYYLNNYNCCALPMCLHIQIERNLNGSVGKKVTRFNSLEIVCYIQQHTEFNLPCYVIIFTLNYVIYDKYYLKFYKGSNSEFWKVVKKQSKTLRTVFWTLMNNSSWVVLVRTQEYECKKRFSLYLFLYAKFIKRTFFSELLLVLYVI